MFTLVNHRQKDIMFNILNEQPKVKNIEKKTCIIGWTKVREREGEKKKKYKERKSL